MLADSPRDAALFAPFAAAGSGDLSRPWFSRRFALTMGEGAEVLAALGDGTPFVVAGKRGRGRVVLVNTSSDAEWNDWPKRRTFVPWVHGLAGAATGQTPWLAGAEGREMRWGDRIVFDSGNTSAGKPMRVRAGEDILELIADGEGKVALIADRIGLHSLLDDAGNVRDHIAVNFPAEESHTDFMSPAELQGQIQRPAHAAPAGAMAAMLHVGQKELWKIILGTGLVLLIAETCLSNRTWA
jgi:hypothetical protein